MLMVGKGHGRKSSTAPTASLANGLLISFSAVLNKKPPVADPPNGGRNGWGDYISRILKIFPESTCSRAWRNSSVVMSEKFNGSPLGPSRTLVASSSSRQYR